ncbi:PaaI family thioesterase [uncultured Bacteroides sp.]|uniref:PaaI family thioesterase n=1 Tax=uncultured Bacteroides sp. TaxID=162156 RepID=UPI002AAA63F6|nr:PaaI family thioesterase [uncultured Bacteroides sp.]
MKKIINPWKDKKGYYCFGCASNNPAGVKMEFYEDGEEIVSLWHLKSEYQGWINTLHGGIQAVLLDEICAWVILRKLQTTGVTSKMETRYLKSVDTTDDYVLLRAHIQEKKRNIILVEAGLYNQQGELCTKALCTYFTFSQEKSQTEMHFAGCDVEEEELDLLI